MLEDKVLVWKLNRGNKEVLRRIYEKYKDDLVTLAAALLHNVSAAEDAVHDVFLSFIESSDTFRLTGSLRGYLSTCVANNARNRFRAKQRRPSIGLDEAELIASGSEGPDYSAIFGEELERLNRALGQLPYEQREVLLLRLQAGMKFRTIADSVGVSVNTIQGRYRYGLDKLRSLLNSEMEK
jgi:RNA polymerase sigma-70 factor (ECF subfamily)